MNTQSISSDVKFHMADLKILEIVSRSDEKNCGGGGQLGICQLLKVFMVKFLKIYMPD